MFSLKLVIDTQMKHLAFRYPDVAAYSITDTLRRTKTEAKRQLLAAYPNLRKANIDWAKIARVSGASPYELKGSLSFRTHKIPLVPFVTNAAATMNQKGIPIKSRIPLQFTGLKGTPHVRLHAFIFREGSEVSDPGTRDLRGWDRFRTFRLLSVSQLVRAVAVKDRLEAFMATTFAQIFAKKLDSMR